MGLVMTLPLLLTIVDIVVGLAILFPLTGSHLVYSVTIGLLYYVITWLWQLMTFQLLYPDAFSRKGWAGLALVGGVVSVLGNAPRDLITPEVDSVGHSYVTLLTIVPWIMVLWVVPSLCRDRHLKTTPEDTPQHEGTTYIAYGTYFMAATLFLYDVLKAWYFIDFNLTWLPVLWLPVGYLLFRDRAHSWKHSYDHMLLYMLVNTFLPRFGILLVEAWLASPEAVAGRRVYNYLLGISLSMGFLFVMQMVTELMKETSRHMSQMSKFVIFIFRAQFVDNFFSALFFAEIEVNFLFWSLLAVQNLWYVFRNPAMNIDMINATKLWVKAKVARARGKAIPATPQKQKRVDDKTAAIFLNNQIKIATQYLMVDMFALVAVPVQVMFVVPLDRDPASRAYSICHFGLNERGGPFTESPSGLEWSIFFGKYLLLVSVRIVTHIVVYFM